MEMHGILTLRISDPDYGRIKVSMENKEDRGIQFQVSVVVTTTTTTATTTTTTTTTTLITITTTIITTIIVSFRTILGTNNG